MGLLIHPTNKILTRLSKINFFIIISQFVKVCKLYKTGKCFSVMNFKLSTRQKLHCFIHNYHQRIALINGVENARAIPNAITAIAKAMATLITGLVFASISTPLF